MRRKIKYIGGVVAAALLAAGSPVIVPMLMPATTVQAYAQNVGNPDETPEEMLDTFKSQFGDRYVASSQSLTPLLGSLYDEAVGPWKFFYFGPTTDPNSAHSLYDLQNDSVFDNLKDANVKAAITKKYGRDEKQYFRAPDTNWFYHDIIGYLSISKDGQTIPTANAEELKSNVIDPLKDGSLTLPLTVTINLYQNPNDGYGDNKTQSIPQYTSENPLKISFTIDSSNFDIQKNTKVPVVNVGSTMADSQLNGTDNSLAIKDNYTGDSQYTASIAAAGKAIYGQTLYKDTSDALTAAGDENFDPKTNTGSASSVLDSDGRFKTPGKYYQTISYDLKGDGSNGTESPNEGADKAIGYMLSGNKDDLTNGTISTYETKINGSIANQGTSENNFALNKTYLTVVREIQIGDSLTAKLSTPTAAVGSDTSKVSSTDSLLSGTETIDATPKYGDTYYTDADATIPATSDEISNGKFLKAKKYYRKVTFDLTSSKTSDFNISGDVQADRTDNSVTYIQEVDVKNGVTAKLATPEVKVGESTSSSEATTGNTLTNTSTPAKSLIDTSEGDYDGVSFGEYYADNDGNLSAKAILDGDVKPAEDAVSADGKTFEKSGTYLRKVTFYLTADAVASNEFDTTDPNLKLSEDNKTVTYVQQIKISKADSITPTIDSPTISVGASTTDTKLADTSNDKIMDGDTSLLDTSKGTNGVELGDTYYDDLSATKAATGISEGKFTIAKTYYRKVKFYLTPEAYNKYSITEGIPSDADNSVTVIQTITVKPSSSGNSGNSGNSNNNGTGSGDEDEWTYYKDPGVVTTKTDQNSYQLNNRANETVKNRELGKDTSWITDQYRTNRAGVKQYRVATGEWVDSHDVYFAEKSTDTEDDWTYYKDPGVVRTVIGQDYYSLNNRANETVKNRALVKQSSWLTDQYRTNRAGVKQYRVATGEWIDSHDVTFIRDIKDVVNVDETDPYYTVYNIDREVVKNRALEKDTSWLTDKQAIDPAGNVYYRVATNEWVKQVEGVYLDTNAWYK